VHPSAPRTRAGQIAGGKLAAPKPHKYGLRLRDDLMNTIPARITRKDAERWRGFDFEMPFHTSVFAAPSCVLVKVRIKAPSLNS
jgi:hypothetical protein